MITVNDFVAMEEEEKVEEREELKDEDNDKESEEIKRLLRKIKI
jgi:hypothetical protein